MPIPTTNRLWRCEPTAAAFPPWSLPSPKSRAAATLRLGHTPRKSGPRRDSESYLGRAGTVMSPFMAIEKPSPSLPNPLSICTLNTGCARGVGRCGARTLARARPSQATAAAENADVGQPMPQHVVRPVQAEVVRPRAADRGARDRHARSDEPCREDRTATSTSFWAISQLRLTPEPAPSSTWAPC